MKLEDSNLLFYPESWKIYREKGIIKFVLFPSLFIFSVTITFFYYIEKSTKEDITSSVTLSAIAALIMFCIRLATWQWKEYKYIRYERNINTYSKKDILIYVLNLIRSIAILIFGTFITLYSLGIFSVNWKSLVHF